MRKLLPVAMIATFFIACKKYNDDPNKVNPTDKSFLIQTYLAAKAEIQAGQLALNKSNSSVVQNFGRRIIDDYRSAQMDVIAIANKLNFALTDTVAIQPQTVFNLNELNGYTFDTAYISSRARSQFSLLSVFENELNNGNNTYVRYYFFNKYVDKVRAYYHEADSTSRAM